MLCFEYYFMAQAEPVHSPWSRGKKQWHFILRSTATEHSVWANALCLGQGVLSPGKTGLKTSRVVYVQGRWGLSKVWEWKENHLEAYKKNFQFDFLDDGFLVWQLPSLFSVSAKEFRDLKVFCMPLFSCNSYSSFFSVQYSERVSTGNHHVIFIICPWIAWKCLSAGWFPTPAPNSASVSRSRQDLAGPLLNQSSGEQL